MQDVGERGSYGWGEFRELVEEAGNVKGGGAGGRGATRAGRCLEKVWGMEDVQAIEGSGNDGSSQHACTIYLVWGRVGSVTVM